MISCGRDRRVLVVGNVVGDAAATTRAIHMALDVVALDQALAMRS
jgi:hypothetical protein